MDDVKKLAKIDELIDGAWDRLHRTTPAKSAVDYQNKLLTTIKLCLEVRALAWPSYWQETK